MRIEQYLSDHSLKQGQKIALITGSKRLSYQEFDQATSALATALSHNGVNQGDRVLIFMDNCWQAAVAIFAILKAGAVFSLVNPSTKSEKLAYIIDDCLPSAIITQARLLPVIDTAKSITDAVPLLIATSGPSRSKSAFIAFESCLETPPLNSLQQGIDIDLAMLIYTSGSTGYPKGVMMTHRNIEAAATSITTLLHNNSDDIILSVLPLSFNYGLYQLLMTVKLGMTLVLEKSFAFPYAIFERMREEKATGFPIVPTMSAMIMQMRDLNPGFLPDLRYITNTAALLPVPHIEYLRRIFPAADIYSMYGLTECKRCTYLPPAMIEQKPDSVGIAIPNSETYLVDETGALVPAGTVGEMVVRGPNVMQGYWNNPDAADQVLRPGFNPWEKVLHTGDLLTMDDDGYFYFIGRKDDIIKSRGEKVPPKEVETVLFTHPGIQEAVVAGVSDPILGQAIAAMIIASDTTLTSNDVILYCKQRLEDFMVPSFVKIVADLPRTDTGKVSRRLAAQEMEAEYDPTSGR